MATDPTNLPAAAERYAKHLEAERIGHWRQSPYWSLSAVSDNLWEFNRELRDKDANILARAYVEERKAKQEAGKCQSVNTSRFMIHASYLECLDDSSKD